MSETQWIGALGRADWRRVFGLDGLISGPILLARRGYFLVWAHADWHADDRDWILLLCYEVIYLPRSIKSGFFVSQIFRDHSYFPELIVHFLRRILKAQKKIHVKFPSQNVLLKFVLEPFFCRPSPKIGEFQEKLFWDIHSSKRLNFDLPWGTCWLIFVGGGYYFSWPSIYTPLLIVHATMEISGLHASILRNARPFWQAFSKPSELCLLVLSPRLWCR